MAASPPPLLGPSAIFNAEPGDVAEPRNYEGDETPEEEAQSTEGLFATRTAVLKDKDIVTPQQ